MQHIINHKLNISFVFKKLHTDQEDDLRVSKLVHMYPINMCIFLPTYVCTAKKTLSLFRDSSFIRTVKLRVLRILAFPSLNLDFIVYKSY